MHLTFPILLRQAKTSLTAEFYGAGDKLDTDPILKLLIVSLFFYGMSTQLIMRLDYPYLDC